MNENSTYLQRVMDALLNRATATPQPETPAPAPPESAVSESKIRSLQLDLEERDRKIEQMRQEYAALQAGRDRAAADSGQEQLTRLFKKLTGTLSNLAALAAYQEAGRDVSAADFAALARSLDKELAKAGLERIGTPGEMAAFDLALHQRMSGAAVHDGGPVTVRVPGYRTGDQILMKAMVSAASSDGETHA